MGLITKEVEIKCRPNNKKHFELFGYKWEYNKEIKVKTKHLTDVSSVKVDIECDGCNKKLENRSWQNYKHGVKNDGKYYCKKCAKNGYKKWVSFEEWCIENNKQDILDRWDYELNNCKPNEITGKAHYKFYFKCPKGTHKSELKNIVDFKNGHNGVMNCKACNSFAQWGIDNLGVDFLEKYWDYKKNKINPWDISYSCHNKVWIRCQEKEYHGSYDICCNTFVTGVRCAYCSNRNGKVHPLDSLGTLHSDVLEIWSKRNKKTPFEYAPFSNQKVWWKCSDGNHEDYLRIIDRSNKQSFRCPECVRERDESFLQEKVRIYLNELGYTVLHERHCNLKCVNPKTNCILPYDNEVIELKLIIEVHGEQHYKITGFHQLSANKNNTHPEYEFHIQQLYDRFKRIYVKLNGYEYLEIPYFTEDNESYKDLINNQIYKISHYLDNLNIIS